MRAAHPATGVTRALDALAEATPRPWLLAIGKAAGPMAEAATAWLAAHGQAPAGGLAITADPVILEGLEVVVGDHPLPGAGSMDAADRVLRFTERLPAGEPVWVLLSGGASSLIAAPADDLSPEDLQHTFRVLLHAGLDITSMNRVRKRITRLSGGALLRALGHRPILQLVVSDVLGDDLATIGSGPLVPDDAPWRFTDLPPALRDALPRRVRDRLTQDAGSVMTAAEATSHSVITRIVSSNAVAVAGAAAEAVRRGVQVRVRPTPLVGEAGAMGAALVSEVLEPPASSTPMLVVAGGETTVTIGAEGSGTGGRCQELALAAALVMRNVTAPIALLAAGTDGRDGPTDCAGALVTPHTCAAIETAGIVPHEALARHDSHTALAAARALVRPGPTGTNVADLVLVIRDADQGPATSGGPAAP